MGTSRKYSGMEVLKQEADTKPSQLRHEFTQTEPRYGRSGNWRRAREIVKRSCVCGAFDALHETF